MKKSKPNRRERYCRAAATKPFQPGLVVMVLILLLPFPSFFGLNLYEPSYDSAISKTSLASTNNNTNNPYLTYLKKRYNPATEKQKTIQNKQEEELANLDLVTFRGWGDDAIYLLNKIGFLSASLLNQFEEKDWQQLVKESEEDRLTILNQLTSSQLASLTAASWQKLATAKLLPDLGTGKIQYMNPKNLFNFKEETWKVFASEADWLQELPLPQLSEKDWERMVGSDLFTEDLVGLLPASLLSKLKEKWNTFPIHLLSYKQLMELTEQDYRQIGDKIGQIPATLLKLFRDDDWIKLNHAGSFAFLKPEQFKTFDSANWKELRSCFHQLPAEILNSLSVNQWKQLAGIENDNPSSYTGFLGSTNLTDLEMKVSEKRSLLTTITAAQLNELTAATFNKLKEKIALISGATFLGAESKTFKAIGKNLAYLTLDHCVINKSQVEKLQKAHLIKHFIAKLNHLNNRAIIWFCGTIPPLLHNNFSMLKKSFYRFTLFNRQKNFWSKIDGSQIVYQDLKELETGSLYDAPSEFLRAIPKEEIQQLKATDFSAFGIRGVCELSEDKLNDNQVKELPESYRLFLKKSFNDERLKKTRNQLIQEIGIEYILFFSSFLPLFFWRRSVKKRLKKIERWFTED